MSDSTFPPDANHRPGDKNQNCGGCVYFSDGKCDVYNASTSESDLCDAYDAEVEEQSDMGNGIEMAELYCSEGAANENDGLIWKTVMRTGTWKYRPGAGQRPIAQPLTVIAGTSTDVRNIIGLEDLKRTFDEGAVEHVTVPKTHRDAVDENTGYVRKLAIDDDPDREGHYILKAGIEFTDPSVKEKVLNRSIANTSCGLYYDYVRKDSGSKYPVALAHVALTNSPWLNGMRPFGLSEEDEVNISSFEFSENMETEETKTENVEMPVISNGTTFMAPAVVSTNSAGAVKISFAARGEWKEKEEGSTPPEKPHNKETVMTVIPGLEGVELAEDAAAAVAAALAAKDAELTAEREAAAALRSSNEELAREKREAEIDAKVQELKDMGLSEQPGFLKVVRQVLLSDDGSQTLELSEDGKTESVSFADVVNKLIDALPTKDGKINFGEQAESLGTEERPAVDATDENLTAEQKYEAAFEDLYGYKPKTK
jgi:hypothetical protein